MAFGVRAAPEQPVKRFGAVANDDDAITHVVLRESTQGESLIVGVVLDEEDHLRFVEHPLTTTGRFARAHEGRDGPRFIACLPPAEKPYLRIVESQPSGRLRVDTEWMGSDLSDNGPEAERRRVRGRRLTDKQALVLELVSEGLENKEIGHRMGLSEQAVKEHVSALLHRLAVRNRAALAEIATQLKIIGTTDLDPEWLGYIYQQSPVASAVVRG